MTQHVNLLRKQHLVPPSLLWGAAGVVLFALVHAGYGLWLVRGNAETQARVLQEEAQLSQLREQVAQAGMRSASIVQLQEDIARLTPVARAFEPLLQQVDGGRLGSQKGYLDHFTTLARTVAPKVWVTQVSVNEAGRKFSLQGQALDEPSVLDYVDRLNQAYAAQGLAMVSVNMNVQISTPNASPRPAGATPVGPTGKKTVSFRLN